MRFQSMLNRYIYTELTLGNTFRVARRLNTFHPSVVGAKIGLGLVSALVKKYNNNILFYEMEVLYDD